MALSTPRAVLPVYCIDGDGQIDEITPRGRTLEDANTCALATRSNAFIRPTGYNASTMEHTWTLYRTAWAATAPEPLKTITSPTIDPLVMYALAKRLHQSPNRAT